MSNKPSVYNLLGWSAGRGDLSRGEYRQDSAAQEWLAWHMVARTNYFLFGLSLSGAIAEFIQGYKDAKATDTVDLEAYDHYTRAFGGGDR